MRSAKSVGRIVGVLFLLHLAAGLTVPFILLSPLRTPPGSLASAAGIPNQVRAAVLVLLVGSAITIGIASAAWSVFRQYNSAMALWLLALAVASFSLWAAGSAGILSMLSLSQEYAKAGVAKAGLFQASAVVVGAARSGGGHTMRRCWLARACPISWTGTAARARVTGLWNFAYARCL